MLHLVIKVNEEGRGGAPWKSRRFYSTTLKSATKCTINETQMSEGGREGGEALFLIKSQRVIYSIVF